MTTGDSKIRLNRFLASCGVASRRGSDQIIFAGRVQINGETVDEPGRPVDPSSDRVEVDGELVGLESHAYYLFHKPKGIICSAKDEKGRKTWQDYLPQNAPRVFTVGRLDRDSEGLLLVTNDGELSNRLLHPSRHVEKEYRVQLQHTLSPAALARLRQGIISDGEKLSAQLIEPMNSDDGHWLKMILVEGKNRQIRRMIEAVGGDIRRLRRVSFGPLKLAQLKAGQMRVLTEKELRLVGVPPSGGS